MTGMPAAMAFSIAGLERVGVRDGHDEAGRLLGDRGVDQGDMPAMSLSAPGAL